MQSKGTPAWPTLQKVIGFLVLAFFAALGLELVGYLRSSAVNGDAQSVQPPTHLAEDTALSPVPLNIPPGQPQWTVAALKRAMARCDAEAVKNPNDLYFLVTPIEPATLEAAASILPPPGDKFDSFFLVPTPSLFGGLQDGSVELSSRRYGFSVLDIKTANTIKWNAAYGASRFADQKAAEISKFRIGFTFDTNTLTWTNEYDRQKGTCYWVNLRFIGQPYLPRSGWANLGVPKSFPSAAASIRCTNHVCERIEHDR